MPDNRETNQDRDLRDNPQRNNPRSDANPQKNKVNETTTKTGPKDKGGCGC